MLGLIIFLIIFTELIGAPADQFTFDAEADSRAYCTSTFADPDDDYISNVTFNEINNSTLAEPVDSYGDYTGLSTEIGSSGIYSLYVTIYSNGFNQHVWAWIDWNQDDIFDNSEYSNEKYDLGEGADLTLTTGISVPEGAYSGTTRLRIVEQYNSDPGPCDPHDSIYGETEDYTINVNIGHNTWTGNADNNWHNPENWYYHAVPDAFTNVTIANVTNKCWVYAGTAYCESINIEYGSGYDLRIYDQELIVDQDMNCWGQLLMDHPDGKLTINRDVDWHSGSRASIQADVIIEVERDWVFWEGANVTINNGFVAFTGVGDSNIISYEDLCYFNSLNINKPAGSSAIFSIVSTDDLYIRGDLNNLLESTFDFASDQSIFLGGLLVNISYIDGNPDGTYVFNGTEQAIITGAFLSDTRMGNLTINSALATDILGSSISLLGNLEINSGTLDCNGFDIQLEGDWTNNVGVDGYVESTGTVFFAGVNPTNITTNETFYNLILNKTYAGFNGLEILESHDVDVNGDLSIDDGTLKLNNYSQLRIDGNLFIANEAGLNAHAGGSEIHLGGNWTNENSTNSYTQGYYGDGELVLFNGVGDQLHSTNASEVNFSNLHINKPSGDFRPGRSVEVSGVFVLFNGDWQDQASGFYHKFGGDIYIEPGGGFYPQESVTMNGGNQTYQNYGGIAMFNDLNINSNGTFTLNTDLILPDNKSLNLENGVLDLNGNSFKGLDIFINDGGEVRIDEGAELLYVDGILVNNGATLTASGVSGNKATIRNESSGYSFIGVYSGGTISANYTDFSGIDFDGVLVYDGALVDPANCFNNCDFIDGINPPTSSRLRIDNDQTLSINNINFNNNPYMPGAYNISKTVNQGEITITTTSGDFTGPLYENDPHNRIHWADYVPGLWTGAVSDDWIDNNNWSDFQSPSITTDVVIPAGTPHNPRLQYSPATCRNLIIENGASLEIVDDVLGVSNNCEIYGELIMTNPLAYLDCHSTMYWKPGSTAHVTNGYIRCYSWIWEEGTLAQLGLGNIAGVRTSIENYDENALFGNLDVWPQLPREPGNSRTEYSLKISGNCTIKQNANWITDMDWIIEGNWIFENGTNFTVQDGAFIECQGGLNLAGELNITTNSEVWVHNIFTFPSTGNIILNEGLFMCDYTLASGWINLFGNITMNLGSLEFPEANISFAGTSSISGGTILAGRTVNADLPGAFQPTGGVLELIGPSSGHYLQIRNGNFVNDLLLNRAASIFIHSGDPLSINGSAELNSELNAPDNLVTVLGNMAINSGGILSMGADSRLEIADNRWLSTNTGGSLEVMGTAGNEATISHLSGYYNLKIGAGGTIRAEHAIFEYLNTEGVHLLNGAHVDPVHSFNNCTFQNGATSGRLLTIESEQNFSVLEAVFPTNSWSGANNVYKDHPVGSVYFINASGGFAGDSYEYDPNALINWGTGLPLINDLMVHHNQGTNEIELSWTYPLSVDHYRIYRSTDPIDFSGADIFTSPTGFYSEPATGTKYFYKVSAESISAVAGDSGEIDNLKEASKEN